ncbi:MAG: ArnT family glycosyltransferase [Vulcanimicrobiaceae bacterium]
MNDSRRYMLPLAAALATLMLHLVGNPHYGFFRDELYFIICGRHPAFGYVDQPPVIPLLSAGSQLFGTSLFALRAVPALFAAGSVFVTCLFVQELEGGAFAQVLAAIVAALTPVLLSFGMKISTDMVGLVAWPLAALFILRIVKGADPRLWLAAGAVVGIALESKYSVMFFAIALLAGLLLTPERRTLFTPWFLAGAALATAIAMPNLLWQAHYGFPMMELLRNGQMGKNLIVGPTAYVVQELFITNPLLAPFWMAGVVWLFMRAHTRWLGCAYVVLIALMIAFHAKHYYPGDVYPIVIAAGCVALEIWTRRLRALRPAVAAYAVVAAAWMIPIVLPILSEQQFLAYGRVLAHVIPDGTLATEHQKRRPELPGDFADMHGWPELAAQVAQAYDTLAPAERADARIYAQNYGEASAIEFFGAHYGLPPVISGHNQYYLWGPRGYDGRVLIEIDDSDAAQQLRHEFQSVIRVREFTAPYVMPYEEGRGIFICRGLKQPIADVWPHTKSYE